jgi:CheY-like chemotaxis protein
LSRIADDFARIPDGMPPHSTLLCVHMDPARLSLLHDNGYELVTATDGHDGLRLLASQPVDAIVLDYHLRLLDGAPVANEMKRVRPTIPIVMLADDTALPDGALNSVDALVINSDGAHFLWATVHFVINVKPAQTCGIKLQDGTPNLRPSPRGSGICGPSASQSVADRKDTPFSAREWESIQTGTVQF